MTKRKMLMIPGPTEVSNEVLEVLSEPIRPHYGAEFAKSYFEVVGKLKRVFQTQNELFILAATSSAAMESAVNSVLEGGDKILICENGFFGQRFAEMAESVGARTVFVRSKIGKPIFADKVKEVLDTEPDIKALAIVHNESSTGVETPIEDIIRIAYEKGVITIVDSVSAMGGVDLPVDEFKIDLCISGSQKCFAAPAGLAFISVSQKAWQHFKVRKTPIHGWYLNLLTLKKYQQQWLNWHPQGPNTAPVSLYLALNQSLDEILAEGLENRFRRHERIAHAFRKAVRAMGLGLFVEDKYASKTLTAVCLQDGIDGLKLRKIIEEEYSILIAGGIDKMANTIVRIGHLGHTATREYLVPTITALEEAINGLGGHIERGIGVRSFVEALDAKD